MSDFLPKPSNESFLPGASQEIASGSLAGGNTLPAAGGGVLPAPGGKALSGNVSQDVLLPAPYPKPQDFGQFAANAGADLSNIKQGLFSLGSFAKSRAYEALLLPKYDHRDGSFIYPQSLVRFEDVPAAVDLVGAVAQSYYKDYLEPVYKQGSLAPIGQRFLEKPISTPLDLMPAVGPTKFVAGKAGQVAEQAATKTAAALGKTNVGAAIGETVSRNASTMADFIAKKADAFVNPIRDNLTFHRQVSQVAETFNQRFINEASMALDAVKDAFDKVPKDLRDDLIEAGEMRDLAKFQKLQGIAEVEDFWKAVNQADGFLSGSLVAGKAMTRVEKMIAQYGPYTKAKTGMTEAQLWSMEGLRAVRQAKRELDAIGRVPTYFGIMTLNQVRQALRIRGSLFGGQRKLSEFLKKGEQVITPDKLPVLERQLKALDQEIENVLKKPGQNLDELQSLRAQREKVISDLKRGESKQPGFLRRREKGERVPGQTANDAYHVFASRYLEGLQFLFLRDFFTDLLTNPKFQAAVDLPAGYTAFNVHDFFHRLGQSQGFSPRQIQGFIYAQKLPTQIHMPDAAALKLSRLIDSLADGRTSELFSDGVVGGKASRMAKGAVTVLEPIANLQKTLQLGFNLGWAVYQQFQNATIYGFATFQGPRDIAASIMAIPLAFDKEIGKALPKWWGADFSEAAPAATQTESYAKAMARKPNPDLTGLPRAKDLAAVGLIRSVAIAKALPHAYMQQIFGIASRGDNWFRRAYGTYQMLRELDRLPPAERALMHEGFSLSAFKKNVIAMSKNEKAATGAGKEIEKWFGKYDELTRSQRRLLRATAPYADWWLHSFSILKALPERPFKTAMMSRLMSQAPLMLQDPKVLTEFELRRGAVALKDTEGNPLRGPNDRPLVMYGSGFDMPLTTPLELIDQGAGLLSTATTDRSGQPLINAGITFAQELLSGENAKTGADFHAPDLVRTRGRSINREGKVITEQKPDILALGLRNIASSQESQLREALAYPDKPSDFTSILNPLQGYPDFRPARAYPGIPVKNFDAATLFLYNFLRLKPNEQRTDKADEESMNFMMEKQNQRALMTQQERFKPGNSALGRMIRGSQP